MAKTLIADIIVPGVFNPYVVEKTAELSALVQAGIISQDAQLDALAKSGGEFINMPFFSDLAGDDEVLGDETDLTPDKIAAAQDVAVMICRGKAWGVNDLTKALSGADPMGAIGDLVAGFWARKEQATLISILTGIFSAASMSNKVLDISAEATAPLRMLNGNTFADACQLMGDAKDRITAVAMHSQTETALAKADLITEHLDSEGKVELKTFMQKRVIVDDGCPVAAGTYDTFLFGEGAIGRGDGEAPVPVETDRDSLGSDDILITRKHSILHPRGVKWGVTTSNPSNAVLAVGTNWTKAYEDKNIRLVRIQHKNV